MRTLYLYGIANLSQLTARGDRHDCEDVATIRRMRRLGDSRACW
jgi:hypothetical protein